MAEAFLLRHTVIARVNMKSVNVVIVGGGVAGVAAASRLISNGIEDVLVLEAQDRLGGRVWTKPFGDGYIDMGAHWVHGQGGNPVYEMVKDLGVVESQCGMDGMRFLTSDGTEIDDKVTTALREKWIEALANEEELKKSEGSIYDYIKIRFDEIVTPLIQDESVKKSYFEWLQRHECSMNGCNSIKEVSAPGYLRYKECEGDSLIVWKKDGYSSIIEILLNRHPACTKGDPIQLEEKTIFNCKIQEIDWSGEEVVVKCHKGGLYRAKHVIVATSLGVLKENHAQMFYPPLPKAKQNAIRSLGFGVVAKVYLEFPTQWWPDICNGFHFLYTDSASSGDEMDWEKEFIGFFSEKTVPRVLCGWLIGDAAQQMEESTDAQVTAGATRVLRKFLGNQFEIPQPVAMIRSQWFSNPYFRGVYSYHSVEADKVNVSAADLASPLANSSEKEVLLFAGEATHPHFFSTVHGAMESGWREADRIIALSNKENE